MAALLVAAVLIAWRWPRSTQTATSQPPSKPSVAEATRWRARPTLQPAAAATSEPESVEPAPEQLEVPPGTIALRRVSLDDLRARAGLPAISPGTIAIDDFPAETDAERADPTHHALYEADRGPSRPRIVAEHEALEAERFARQASDASSADHSELLARAGTQHGELAARYRRRATELQRRRETLLAELANATPPAPPEGDVP